MKRHRIILGFGTLLCLLPVARAGGGDAAGNGGGVAEQYVTFAYLNLERYLDLCLASESCRPTTEERSLLRLIRARLPDEYATKAQLVFKSGKLEPGFFHLDGQVRIARTGDAIGSPIYLNVDLLYSMGPLGDVVPLGLSTAVAVLVHELGHHHAVKDHAALDVLGAKVATLLRAQTQEISVSPFENEVVATAINFHLASGNFTQLLVADGKKVLDFSGELRARLKCPDELGSQIAFLLVWNLHWMRELSPTSERKLVQRIPLRGQLMLQCVNAQGARLRRDQDVALALDFERDQNAKLSLIPGAFRLWQVDCSAQPNDCH